MNQNPLQIDINGVTHQLLVTFIGADFVQLSIDGDLYDLPITRSSHNNTDLSHPRDNAKNDPTLTLNLDNPEIRCQMSGKVIAIYVQPNDSVSIGQPLCTIEAMKMEQTIISPINSIIDNIYIQPMESVSNGQLLMTFKKP